MIRARYEIQVERQMREAAVSPDSRCEVCGIEVHLLSDSGDVESNAVIFAGAVVCYGCLDKVRAI